MAYRLLRREGWTVNHMRVQRIWREEGLQRPTPRKRKRARPADGSVWRHRAEHPHQFWAKDFQFDATADGGGLKFLNVIDEHSRLCLAIRVGRRCKAKDVVTVLEELTSLNPAPASSARITGQNSLPRLCGIAVRPAQPPARPTSRRDPHGRTDSLSRSTAGSAMNSSIPSCSPQLLRPKSWRTVGAGSTTHSGCTRLSRCSRPWRQLNRELQHDHTHPLS
jgi:hypothetical protein